MLQDAIVVLWWMMKPNLSINCCRMFSFVDLYVTCVTSHTKKRKMKKDEDHMHAQKMMTALLPRYVL